MPQYDKSLVWFRRDLRLHDHAALHAALMQSRQVFCAFIFDTEILDALPPQDRRVEFILGSLTELDAELRNHGGKLIVRHGRASEEIPRLTRELKVDAVFTHRDYEPAAEARDARVGQALSESGCRLFGYKDHAVFDTSEVLSQAGHPFSVFTPYKNAWMKRLASLEASGMDPLAPHIVEPWLDRLAKPAEDTKLLALADLGFETTDLHRLGIKPGMSGAQALLDDFASRIDRYNRTRDFPAVKGPSYLSVHLRFGTLSIRTAARMARDMMRTSASPGAVTWLSELIWRDFYFMILHHHPHVAERSFKPAYDRITWETGTQADSDFRAWCEGRTGYPLVDAAMRQLNTTGYMHNRLRMVSACFLIKDLGIDWRRGERYFAEKLNDFDLAANNGGWQWASSSGCDAQPYFRIFNPVTQSEKFDPEGKFIRRYVPELAGLTNRSIHAPWLAKTDELQQAGVALGKHYPEPLVDHAQARERTLQRYAVVKSTDKEGKEYSED